MRKLLIVIMLVCLPLQWGWANVHVAADAAHMVNHNSHDLAAWLVAPIGNLNHSLEHAHSHDGDHQHGESADHAHTDSTAHDHHSHYLTVLALGIEALPMPETKLTQCLTPVPVYRLDANVLSRIERPKWPDHA
ncbi:MAG: hypothetical protein ACKVIH_08820 [Burkholderiales bacterium]